MRHHEHEGLLPIHRAAEVQNPEFCQFLIDRHPQSLEIGVKPSGKWNIHWSHEFAGRGYDDSFARGSLPLHVACYSARLDVVKLLHAAYPDAICASDDAGNLPMQVCRPDRNDDSEVAEVKDFCEAQLGKSEAMVCPDGNGRLPLHRALERGASLDNVKLLMKGNPSAVRVIDDDGALPIHLACQHETCDVVEFLEKHYGNALNAFDSSNNYPLHYACLGGNYGVVKYLLERQTPSILLRNSDNMLPIQLFCEATQGPSWESREHVETIWRLLLADPQTVMK